MATLKDFKIVCLSVIVVMGMSALPASADIGQTIENGFKALKGGQKKISSELETLFTEVEDTDDHLLREQIRVESDLKREKTFGTLAQPSNACTAPSLSANSYAAKIAGTTLSRKVSDIFHDIQGSFSNRSIATGSLFEDMTWADAKPEKTNPENDTYAEEDIKAAVKLAALTIDPAPTLALPAEASTSQAAEYNRLFFLKNAKLAFPQEFAAEGIIDKSPLVVTENWKEEILTSTGEELPEKISRRELLNLMVKSRFNNMNWIARLNEMYGPGLLREDLILESVLAEYEKRKIEMLEKIAVLSALQSSEEVGKMFNAPLNSVRKDAMVKE